MWTQNPSISYRVPSLGSLYAQHVFGIEHPRVGLLNIGEEETKGNEQAKETYPLLKAERNINFAATPRDAMCRRATLMSSFVMDLLGMLC